MRCLIHRVCCVSAEVRIWGRSIVGLSAHVDSVCNIMRLWADANWVSNFVESLRGDNLRLEPHRIFVRGNLVEVLWGALSVCNFGKFLKEGTSVYTLVTVFRARDGEQLFSYPFPRITSFIQPQT